MRLYDSQGIRLLQEPICTYGPSGRFRAFSDVTARVARRQHNSLFVVGHDEYVIHVYKTVFADQASQDILDATCPDCGTIHQAKA